MAEGFAEVFGGEKLEVYSAGSIPSPQIDPIIIEVMKEKGIDLSSKRPKGLNDLPPIEMDYLKTIGCEDPCPGIPSKNTMDMIEGRVRALLKEIEWRLAACSPEANRKSLF